MAGSVALFTYCQAVQLSAMTNFVILNWRTQEKIKNCKFFGPKRQNNFSTQLTCMYVWVPSPRSGVHNVACSSSIFEALLLSVRGCSRSKMRCIALPTNLHMPRLSVVRGLRKPLFFLCVAASCIDSVSYSYASYILYCPCTSNVPFTPS